VERRFGFWFDNCGVNVFCKKQSFCKMKEELNKLLLRLKQDEFANISAIGFIENNPIIEVVEINNSYLIKGTSDVEWT
jgi:hypothetical protein